MNTATFLSGQITGKAPLGHGPDQVPASGKQIFEFEDGWLVGEISYKWVPAPVEEKPVMTLYSQYDPLWRYLEYAGGVTFGKAGCYTIGVAMVLSLAGYTDKPPEVARKLREAGCFIGANLARPDRIPDAYPKMRYDGPIDVSKDGELRWHGGKADMDRVWKELGDGPVIMEVDFKPGGEFNQHFVVAEEWDEAAGDIKIADPWGGERVLLLERYSLVWQHWDLSRAIYGLRLLRAKDE